MPGNEYDDKLRVGRYILRVRTYRMGDEQDAVLGVVAKNAIALQR